MDVFLVVAAVDAAAVDAAAVLAVAVVRKVRISAHWPHEDMSFDEKSSSNGFARYVVHSLPQAPPLRCVESTENILKTHYLN